MRAWYGGSNKSALGRDTGIQIGGAQRVLGSKANVGIELIAAIARRAGLQPWQLLVPGLNPHQPPELAGSAPYAADAAAGTGTPPAAGSLNELERQLLQFFRGMSDDHRDDLLIIGNRWYAQAQPQVPSAANPFQKKHKAKPKPKPRP